MLNNTNILHELSCCFDNLHILLRLAISVTFTVCLKTTSWYLWIPAGDCLTSHWTAEVILETMVAVTRKVAECYNNNHLYQLILSWPMMWYLFYYLLITEHFYKMTWVYSIMLPLKWSRVKDSHGPSTQSISGGGLHLYHAHWPAELRSHLKGHMNAVTPMTEPSNSSTVRKTKPDKLPRPEIG